MKTGGFHLLQTAGSLFFAQPSRNFSGKKPDLFIEAFLITGSCLFINDIFDAGYGKKTEIRMTFSTSTFLFLFFPVVFIVCYLIPEKKRNAFLFFVSLVFCFWAGLDSLLILIVNLLWNYFAGLVIEKYRESKAKKLVLTAAIAGNAGLLIWFTYIGFIADTISSILSRPFHAPEVLLPIGISFYTLQSISYIVDVYHGEAPLKNPIDMGLYITFFPQLIAGPIVRLSDIMPFLHDRKRDLSEIMEGFERFLSGLCKKVLIADPLGLIADEIVKPINYSSDSVLFLWVKAAAFSLQIYYDFSGYSDMAVGLGHMFGFTIPENFNYPYCAATFKDFWRRWHISLSMWFRDYVYIPLGGSRNGRIRHILNLLIVWVLSGLWHKPAWTFVVWALIYFVMLSLESYVIKPERFSGAAAKVIYRIFLIICIGSAWVIFKSPDIASARSYLTAMYGLKDLPLYNKYTLFVLRNNKLLFPAAVLFSMPVVPFLRRRKEPVAVMIYYVGLLLAVLLSAASILLDAYNPFLYFQF